MIDEKRLIKQVEEEITKTRESLEGCSEQQLRTLQGRLRALRDVVALVSKLNGEE